jgi:ADP-ribosylglycohydrolase
MKNSILLIFTQWIILCSSAQKAMIAISKETLKDKIMGGWAGQTIGVTFGGPYEFRFQGTFIGDYQPLLWYDGYLKKTMLDNPGLYDDLYMDLSFVDVIEKNGIDAPVDSFANAYAHAGYMLWHANQAGRYNLLNGIKAPQSGYWLNNPHADCIDYQIESDYAGLMSPCMPNVASAISDKVGHIMNYGDGWYGGVFVGAMYTIAFRSDDISFIIQEALKTIPAQSEFNQCIQDVIVCCKKYPGDWKQTWLEVQRKWADDVGCPDGVFSPFDIDAKVNAAYVVMGLLYGKGDFTRSLEIATRCGQDADCNPSTVGGILGALLGYKKIPHFWKMGLEEAALIPFKYTSMCLNDVYKMGFKHALLNIEKNGGKIARDSAYILSESPVAVRFEKSFEGHFPTQRIPVSWSASKDEIDFEFTGIGFVLKGNTSGTDDGSGYVFQTELFLDGKLIETASLPVSFTTRRTELCWKYQLPLGRHQVKFKILNPSPAHPVSGEEAIIYGNKPVNGIQVNVIASEQVRK